MLFEPTWISSPEHLAQFEQIYAQAGWIRCALGAYRLPPGFPHIQMPHGILGRRPVVPIVMFSQGRLKIEAQTIEFEAQNLAAPHGALRMGLRTEWTWAIAARDLISVESYERPAPVLRYYATPFVRVRTRHPDPLLRDFLVCVGGYGPSMARVRQQSAELCAALQSLAKT